MSARDHDFEAAQATVDGLLRSRLLQASGLLLSAQAASRSAERARDYAAVAD